MYGYVQKLYFLIILYSPNRCTERNIPDGFEDFLRDHEKQYDGFVVPYLFFFLMDTSHYVRSVEWRMTQK